jgi:hypothetical protein
MLPALTPRAWTVVAPIAQVLLSSSGTILWVAS